MTINAILACDANYGIGKNGGLPWPHSDADMKWFRECTRDGVVLMGRKTWDSIGSEKLAGRINIVVSHSPDQIKGEPDIVLSVAFFDMGKALQNFEMEYPSRKIWIIGGAEIYTQTLPFCNNVYLTQFKETYDCDTFIDKSLLTPFSKMASRTENSDQTFSIWSKF